MMPRAWWIVPGDSASLLAKIPACSAGAVIIDLEATVTCDDKAKARSLTRNFLEGWQNQSAAPRLYVRINALDSGITSDDLAASISPATKGIVLPKAEGGQDMGKLAALMRVAEARAGVDDGATRMIAVAAASASGVLNIKSYAGCSNRLEALTWDARELLNDIGARSARDETGNFTPPFALARAMVLLGAAAAGVSAIDGISTTGVDEAALRRECAEAVRDGFTGKMTMDPAQVAIINEVFSPCPHPVWRNPSDTKTE
jgi:citrate lyase subunit beta/citryl-CoA lyase